MSEARVSNYQILEYMSSMLPKNNDVSQSGWIKFSSRFHYIGGLSQASAVEYVKRNAAVPCDTPTADEVSLAGGKNIGFVGLRNSANNIARCREHFSSVYRPSKFR